MSSTAGDGARPHVHEALVYDTEEHLADVAVPFIADALAAEEPVLVVPSPRLDTVVRNAFGPVPGIELADQAVTYSTPASAVRTLREIVDRHTTDGAGQVRAIAELPPPDRGTPWEGWARYEAAVNHLFADLSLWVVCAYDGHSLPDAAREHVEQTHPRIVADGAHVPNPRYVSPEAFIRSLGPPRRDVLEESPPLLRLADPTPLTARHAVSGICRSTSLPRQQVDDFVLAVSEVVANAEIHGRPPIDLRLWVDGDRAVAAVTDRGHGPSDPFAGLRPVPDRDLGGLGLWMAHQLCSHVAMSTGEEGFTIRLHAGPPRLTS